MNMRVFGFLIAAAAVACTSACGQEALGHKQKPVPTASVPAAPVTQAEAKATFTHVQSSLSSVAGKPMTFAPSALTASSKPVTRQQVLAEMDRLYKGAKPYFKMTPKPVWYDPSVFTIKGGTARPILERMVKGGFVSRVGVLATSKQDTLSPFDFGDSVGIFVSRLAENCHLPSTEYSPYLEKQ